MGTVCAVAGQKTGMSGRKRRSDGSFRFRVILVPFFSDPILSRLKKFSDRLRK